MGVLIIINNNQRANQNIFVYTILKLLDFMPPPFTNQLDPYKYFHEFIYGKTYFPHVNIHPTHLFHRHLHIHTTESSTQQIQ